MVARQSLSEIEASVLALSARRFGFAREALSLDTRPVQDLGIDSLDLAEWVLEIEECFDVSLPDPNRVGDSVYKEVFTRPELTLRDMAELIHIRWGNGPGEQPRRTNTEYRPRGKVMFSQLGGRLVHFSDELYRPLGVSDAGIEQFRRMTDGMVCLKLPGGGVEIGSNCADAHPDERPTHSVDIAPFLIDRETVSTTAYCRFLNSIEEPSEDVLKAWFLITANERRFDHQLITRADNGWTPLKGSEEWPMVLVSWHGANAYSLWANGEDWRDWRSETGVYLPGERQWEYAARGPISKRWPWGDRDPRDGEINAGIHARGAIYSAITDLRLAAVSQLSGVSPFGVLQMAGNVWQRYRDWYDPAAYSRLANRNGQPVQTGVRSERGGSWVSPVNLSRSSYRRGRVPHARGRCLGFRCIGAVPTSEKVSASLRSATSRLMHWMATNPNSNGRHTAGNRPAAQNCLSGR